MFGDVVDTRTYGPKTFFRGKDKNLLAEEILSSRKTLYTGSTKSSIQFFLREFYLFGIQFFFIDNLFSSKDDFFGPFAFL